MRRIDIINAARNISNAFKESNIITTIVDSLYRSDKKLSPEVVIASFYEYVRHFNNFGPNEKTLLEVFGISGIESPTTLSTLMNGEKVNNSPIPGYYRGLNFALEYLPKIIDLVKQSNINYEIREESSFAAEKSLYDERSLITIILPEGERESSSPERLVKALESIRLLYSVFAKLNDVNDNDLSVVAIDSGSDKSFDFLGAAKLMESTKELLLELWDRIVFHREKKAHEKLDLLAKSLPILDRIGSLEQDGKLGKEQCEILRRSVVAGAENFISSGAVLPDFYAKNTHDPRELMSPERKLLVESNDHLKKENPKHNAKTPPELDTNFEIEEFTEEDLEMLRMMKTKKNSKK